MTDQDEVWTSPPTYHGRAIDGIGVEVTVETDGQARVLQPKDPAVGFGWGKPVTRGVPTDVTLSNARGTQLAFAILMDALGSEREVLPLIQRFKHRTVLTWAAGSPWSITLPEIQAIIADIRGIDMEAAKTRAAISYELPPVDAMFGGHVMAPVAIDTGRDQAPDRMRAPPDPATLAAREAALAKLTPEERKALGL